MVQTDIITGIPSTSMLQLGSTNIAQPDANYALTAAQYSVPFGIYTGAITANRTNTLPLVAGAILLILNKTTGGFSLIFQGASGSSATVTNGSAQWIACDGTNWYTVA